MFPVMHKNCGEQVGWFLNDVISDNDRIRAETFRFMDGSRPESGSLINIKCKCGDAITKPSDLVRSNQPGKPSP